ncbi:sigma-70 family RNA polymerase sigma factor [Streptomyces decoyicus]|uniref:hypothetical protein n=1 Tax=Streptomyces decoyicus TaxID=249567 RepID=UPI003662A8B9
MAPRDARRRLSKVFFARLAPARRGNCGSPEWSVHVPRRLQELRGVLARDREELAAHGVHEPTVADLARHLDLSEDEVIDGLVACIGYDSDSIDRPIATGGGTDRRSGLVADLVGDDMTQTQIADELGPSHMHVSRLLTRTYTTLRAGLLAEA